MKCVHCLKECTSEVSEPRGLKKRVSTVPAQEGTQRKYLHTLQTAGDARLIHSNLHFQL